MYSEENEVVVIDCVNGKLEWNVVLESSLDSFIQRWYGDWLRECEYDAQKIQEKLWIRKGELHYVKMNVQPPVELKISIE